VNGIHQEDTQRAVERVARESYGRLVAYLSANTHDVAAAEDALSEALLKALKVWPTGWPTAESRGLAVNGGAEFDHQSYSPPTRGLGERADAPFA
jgi:hypothetical protein